MLISPLSKGRPYLEKDGNAYLTSVHWFDMNTDIKTVWFMIPGCLSPPPI
jgi:hypothetical protein